MKNESFLKPYYLILALFICGFMHSQSYSYFLYESSANQYFRFHPGASKKMLYVNMDRNDIVFNSIFNIDESTSKLIIPSSGFYDILLEILSGSSCSRNNLHDLEICCPAFDQE